MNAYDIYAAAYDSAQSEWWEDTIEYITQYADGAMGVALSGDVAQKILDCRLAWVNSDQSADHFWHTVEKPLASITL